MKQKNIIQDYYGALYYIEKNKDKELTIFVIDDLEIYLNLIKEELSSHPNFSVHTFTTGEEALDYLGLHPDLVILDFHLDGRNPYAQKGDVIYQKIKEKVPSAEVVMVSSDEKLVFIEELRNRLPAQVLLKDENALYKLNYKIDDLLLQKKQNAAKWKVLVLSIIVVIALAAVILFL